MTGSVFDDTPEIFEADSGGAIFTSAVTDVEASTFVGNRVFSNGGAITYTIDNRNPSETPSTSLLKLNQDEFDGNQSTRIGGAVFVLVNVDSGRFTVSVYNSTFFANQVTNTAAQALGGGLAITQVTTDTGSVSATLTNDTFFQNVSQNRGGGLAISLANTGTGANTADLTSLTVYQNRALIDSAGLFVDAAANNVVLLDNSILDGNTVTNVGYNGPVDVTFTNSAAVSDLGYNLLGTTDITELGDEFDIFNNNTGLANTLVNDNFLAFGGPQKTLALARTSPGYEMGDPTLAGQIDERGYIRRTGQVSIGAEDPDAR